MKTQRRSLAHRTALFVLVVALAACTDHRPLTSPEAVQPQFDLWDGAHASGNAHFFFLPPMVPASSYSGTFDDTLAPVVTICALSGGGCGATIARFTTTSGPGSETVRVDPVAEQYIVNWNTSRFALAVGGTYRITVTVGDFAMGFADAIIVANGRAAGAVDATRFAAVTNGRTLPIKFRIEFGAVPTSPRYTALSAGWKATCAVRTNGVPYCWGYTIVQTATSFAAVPFRSPTLVAGTPALASVGAGSFYACGLATAGDLWCWGKNDNGVLGFNPPMGWASLEPGRALSPQTFTQISTGYAHACGLLPGGSVLCWGNGGAGNGGAWGAGVSGLADVFSQVAAGGSMFTCGLTSTGQVLCWGSNDFGQLGYTGGPNRQICWGGVCNTFSDRPWPVEGDLTFTSISAGAYHACGIAADGTAYCWGSGWNGELGGGTTGQHATPSPVSTTLHFQSISAGSLFTCGLIADGSAYCWGWNEWGTLGNEQNASSSVPVPVSGGSRFTAIRAGYDHACGLTTDRRVYCWGLNDWGQLGNAEAPYLSRVPVEISSPSSP